MGGKREERRGRVEGKTGIKKGGKQGSEKERTGREKEEKKEKRIKKMGGR